MLGTLLNWGTKAADKLFPDRTKHQEKQLEINAETERNSGGAMTPRKLLMYALALAFVWEVMLRPAVATYWPHLPLPPSDRTSVV